MTSTEVPATTRLTDADLLRAHDHQLTKARAERLHLIPERFGHARRLRWAAGIRAQVMAVRGYSIPSAPGLTPDLSAILNGVFGYRAREVWEARLSRRAARATNHPSGFCSAECVHLASRPRRVARDH